MDMSLNGAWLRDARAEKGWTQAQAAKRLRVSQTYLSLLEHGRRPLSRPLARRAVKEFAVPPSALPVEGAAELRQLTDDDLAAAVATVGYPGFGHLRGGVAMNPATLLLIALRMPDLDPRVTESLPWVAWRHCDLNWEWLVKEAKLHDLQNRLGFVIALAKAVAERREDAAAVKVLADVEALLERSRLVREDTLARESMTDAERRWLRRHRPEAAAHWNLLTGLAMEHLAYAT